jgi:acyl carrier protein
MKTTAEILKDIRPDADYSASSNFIADGLLDSLDIIRLVTELGANFGISIEGTDIVSGNFVDLASIERLVRRARSGTGGS